jgi:hypothetical protein
MKKSYVRPILAGVLLVLAVAGCAGTRTVTVTETQPPQTQSTASQNANANQTCTFGATGADVEVQITNDSATCSQEEQALATFGISWYPISTLTPVSSPGSADGETENTTCVLSKGGSTITVEDSGEMFKGTEICSSEEQSGWVNTQ